MTTKEKILSSGMQLFNKEGVEKITTRHIAAHLGMSQGNLHYHFSQKEVVIEALFDQFLEKVAEAARFQKGRIFTNQDMLGSMSESFEIMYSYRFLFRDSEVVWRRVEGIQPKMQDLFDQKRIEIATLISQYKKEGRIRSEIDEQQLDSLADQLLFTIVSWLNAPGYYKESHPVHTKPIEYFVDMMYRIWVPYLSEKELQEWKRS